LISVIIPTWRRNQMLFDRAIPSILRQTVPTGEIIIVHDGNARDGAEERDEVRDLERRAAELGDSRIRIEPIRRQKYPPIDRWLYWGLLGLKALNHGLAKATGEWVAVLNDDDEFLRKHHEILLGLATPGTDFVYGKSATPWGQEYGGWPPGDGQLTQGSYLYRGKARDYRYDLKCLSRTGLNGDADMWTRMYAEGVQFKQTDKMVHRYHPSSTRNGE